MRKNIVNEKLHNIFTFHIIYLVISIRDELVRNSDHNRNTDEIV